MGMTAASSSSSRKRMAVVDSDRLESVISIVMNHIDDMEERNHYLESLSMVSKQLLSLTNTFLYSIKLINNPSSLPIISRIFNRLPNLTSLDLSAYRGRANLNTLLSRIPPLSFSRLKSLNLSNHPTFPASGLRSILTTNNKLTSLICSNISSLKFTDIIFIADSFPFLQHFDLSFPGGIREEGLSVDDKEDYNNAMNLLVQKVWCLLMSAAVTSSPIHPSLHSLPTVLYLQRSQWSQQILDSVQHRPWMIWLYTLKSSLSIWLTIHICKTITSTCLISCFLMCNLLISAFASTYFNIVFLYF